MKLGLPNLSIRLRLTVLYSAILALTLIAFSAVLYVSQTHFTYDNIKANLTRQAELIGSGPRRFPARPSDGQPGSAPDGGAPVPGVPEGTLPGRWTQTRDMSGAVTGRSFDLVGLTLPLSDKGLRAVQAGQGRFETATVEGEPLLIYSQAYATQPGNTQAGTNQIVQIALPIGEREQSLRTLALILIIGCSVVILAAFVIGWALAGTVLQPIHRITQTAQAIGAEHDFSRRVEHTGPPDEIGQLARTFNAMLAELELTYRQIQGALDFQRRFVADASHELRTPLTTVRGNMELLGRQPPVAPEERAEILADTTGEVDRLIRLVNQLLVLARADAGQALPRSALPLQPLLDDVHRQARCLAPGRDIACGPAADVEVLANRDALKQVLLILIDNAIVHTNNGARVSMATEAIDGEVRIRVRDTGPGMPADVLEHIFERFYRGQVSRSGTSTGLGLAIAKELVEAQSGTISVESQPGRGSVFTVTLPQPGAAVAGE